MYKVVKDFTDLKDKNHVYLAGDEYPRKGVKPSAKRIAELSSKSNKRGEVLIEEIVTEKAASDAPQKAEIPAVKGEKPVKKESVKKEPKAAKKEDIKEK